MTDCLRTVLMLGNGIWFHYMLSICISSVQHGSCCQTSPNQ